MSSKANRTRAFRKLILFDGIDAGIQTRLLPQIKNELEIKHQLEAFHFKRAQSRASSIICSRGILPLVIELEMDQG